MTNTTIPRTMIDDSEDYYEFAVIPKEGHVVIASSCADASSVQLMVSDGDDKPCNAVDLTYSQTRALRDALDKILAFENAV